MALPGYLEDTGKHLAKQMTATYSAPIDTSKFAQQIAPQDPLQTQAIGLATAGVGSYTPYLTGAQAAMGQAGTAVGGLGALTGPTAYQPFQSPYQQQVIDETLRQYDLSRGAGQQEIKDAAVMSGNFGGGREGAQLGQYGADTLANRAGLRAGLLQQGLGQAQQQAQQAFGNQQAHQTAAYEPYGRLGQYAQGITGLAGGMAAPQYAQQGAADPWGGALSTALGVGGLFKQLF